MKNTLAKLGQAIKAKRLRLAVSQEELAERCGFDRTYISMLERGKRNPSLGNLIRLAKGLNTTVATLVRSIDGAETD
jgi:transcriptional regulator with XRE-family HTH domain